MTYTFERYRDGVKMAQGVIISKATSFEEACCKATSLARMNGCSLRDILVLVKVETGE